MKRITTLAITAALAGLMALMSFGLALALAGDTTRVSVDSGGAQGNSDVGDNTSISADGRYVAFSSEATNMVAGDTNETEDIFIHDRQTGATTRVSVPNLGDQGTLGSESDQDSSRPSISADGRYGAFQSRATNLVAGDSNGTGDIFVHDTGFTDSGVVAFDSFDIGDTEVELGPGTDDDEFEVKGSFTLGGSSNGDRSFD